jgi:hypothetical protein
MPTPIPLLDPSAASGPRITQLYAHLELLSEGNPPANTLFVMGRDGIPTADALLGRSQLLVVDPPDDLITRFRLEDDAAVIFTGAPRSVGLPVVQTAAGGVAHLRIGDHFLDIYVQQNGVVLHIPALGIIVGGGFGSDCLPPTLGENSTGEAELDTLRLLARLLKARNFQLYIPADGATSQDRTAVMERLASDVAYLHGLRRVIPPLVQRGEPLETVERITDSLLPANCRSPHGEAIHEQNVQVLVEAARASEN